MINKFIPSVFKSGLLNPGSWLKKGDSPAEIILASAVLVMAITFCFAVYPKQPVPSGRAGQTQTKMLQQH
jgi:hypothetical protein